MPKSAPFLLLVVVTLGVWFFLKNYEIEGLDQLRIVPRAATTSAADAPAAPSPEEGGTIRLASFNIQTLGSKKLSQPGVVDVLARTIRQFDLVAVQEIRSKRQDLLPQLLEAINATGRKYNFVIGTRVGRSASQEQYAYLFDEATIEVDRTSVYTVSDPDDLLHRPPLVASFRARGPPPDQAFTFTLVNVHTDPDEAPDEVSRLDDVMFAVRSDGRDEDDVILIGDFNTDVQHIGDLSRIAGITAAITDQTTNTRQTHQYDNLFMQLPATAEFTGRSGVFDFLRNYNLTLDQALLVSDHLPVWAEFYRAERAATTAVAAAPSAAATR